MGKSKNIVRTPGGIHLGDRVPIKGKRGVHIHQGNKEEDLLPEQIVECITGRNVARIVYSDEMNTLKI